MGRRKLAPFKSSCLLGISDSSCSVVGDKSKLNDVYLLPATTKKELNFDGLSLNSLIESLLSTNFSKKFFAKNLTIVNGIEGIQWIGCKNLTTQIDTAIQVLNLLFYDVVEVAFAADNSTLPYSSSIRNPLTLSVHFYVYNVSNQNITDHVSLDIVEIDVPKSDVSSDYMELPKGMYCNGMQPSQIGASLPNKFEASFDYTDVYGKMVNDVDMLYDGSERIISFRMNVRTDRDAPFIGNISLPKDFALVTVIHDFKYGLQYIIDSETSACKEVKAIESGFGDIYMVNDTTQEIDLKSANQILMNISASEFYYGGKRLSDENAEMALYVSRSNSSSQGTYTVVELLFSTEPWVFDSAEAPFLHSIIQYHKNKSDHEIGRSVIRLHSFVNSSGQVSRWNAFWTHQCLKLVEDSYLHVNIKNCSMSDMEQLGIPRVESSLKETIAHTARVSVLRVANFFYKQIQESVVVFFAIGETSGVAPANTKDRMNESSLAEAINWLNSTLMDRDVAFSVFAKDQKKTELKLARSSLGLIPSQWLPSPDPPSPSFNGYTGGSMFVLGVFMLLLGAAVGVGGMFFVWKRQRISGLAYQVFE
ncbi:unnamed protein product [Anisakis simplex]|uniref:Protein kinase domain-containing protein n=1 Tax=Anisakis simplex TaxID=6269 RepID=A0A0M3JSH5_ANISI|nr:unnamed protein product [Anisakis simplex]